MKEELKEVGQFPPKVKPVRDGVYKRRYPTHGVTRVWCLFSKGRWYCSSYRYAEAKREMWPSNYQELPWWGMAK